MQPGMLAAAYATRSAVPLASTLPSSLSVVVYHTSCAAWYAARSPYISSLQRRLTWCQDGVAQAVQPGTASAKTIATFVASALLQWPLCPPSAAALPFVACCVLGLKTSIGSNVMLLAQTLLLIVAVVFDGALLVPLLSTAVALIGFGASAARADPACFFMAAVGHLAFALLGGVALVNTQTLVTSVSLSRTDALCACFCAVLCSEARIRTAASATRPRKRVMWACRAASFGCIPYLVVRGLAETKTLDTPHISTVALACVAACSPWFWTAHRAWRTHRVSPPSVAASDALMLGVVLVCLAVLAITLPTLSSMIEVIEVPSR